MERESKALETWREKLEYLLTQEAVASDPAQKFALGKQIQEARQNILDLERPKDPPPRPRAIRLDRLPTVAGEFFGRENELRLLDQALATDEPRIVEFVAPGGTGKTKLLRHWLDKREADIPALIAWSFYSQGAGEDKQVSSSPFFGEAFRLLGEERTQFPTEEEKGRRLAELLIERRCLLVLDGLEPMQHAGKGMRGELKDRAILALLKSLLSGGALPCLVATRLRLPELQDRRHAESRDLHDLAEADGVKLLRSLKVRGREDELRRAVRDYGRHALALHLLGNALRVFCEGDIAKRDKLPELLEPERYANDSPTGLHAFKVMRAYRDWLKDEQGRDLPELRLLYLLGLFDHPVELPTLQMLWREAIPGLTAWDDSPGPTEERIGAGTADSAGSQASGSPLSAVDGLGVRASLTERQWQTAVAALRDDHRLLTRHEGQSAPLDCHPLIREYFGRTLQSQNPLAWTQAHRRLYDYYKALPKQERPDSLEDLRPLFHAVAHGCAAGLHRQALNEVYWPRIQQGSEAYLVKKLGAFGDDLAVLAQFFERPWDRPAAGLSDDWQPAVLNWAGFRLRALGRLREAAEPMRASVEMAVQQEDWINAAIGTGNLGELLLTLGEVASAIDHARLAMDYADRSGEWFQHMAKRTILAEALHQAGDDAAAHALFEEAERLQQEFQPKFPRLYSLAGFQYCELLLAQGDATAASERAEDALTIAERNKWLLDVALDRLTLGRAYMQQAAAAEAGQARDETGPETPAAQPARPVDAAAGPTDHEPRGDSLGQPERKDAQGVHREPNRGQSPLLQQAGHWLNLAVAGFRQAGYQQYVPLGLLAHAAYCRQTGDFAAAREDLREIFELAETGGMLLHLTDAHLEAARLALAYPPRPSEERPLPKPAAEHLQAAAKLIEQTGYLRRLPELQALSRKLPP